VKIREIGGKMLLPYEQQELVGNHQGVYLVLGYFKKGFWRQV
jgi:hypothetical protein